MAHTSLRFVHAGPLRLDAPLRGTGPLSSNMRRLAVDATLIAWERVVDICLERSADFLLITGAVFDRPPTIRAVRAFIDGCAALAEFDVEVFAYDPALAPDVFHAFPLPENVRILDRMTTADWTGPQRRPVQFVPSGTEPVGDTTGTDREPAAFRIAIGSESTDAETRAEDQSFDYVAVSVLTPPANPNGNAGVLHGPGAMQGLGRSEPGPHGVSLVELDLEGRVDITPVPTAPVRWESFAIPIDSAMGRQQLVERMQASLLEHEASIGERLWIVHWQCTGDGPLLESLADARGFTELCRDVESGLGGKSAPEREHRRNLICEVTADEDSLLREYVRTLDAPTQDYDLAELQRRMPSRQFAVDGPAAREIARRLGGLWLAAGDRPPKRESVEK